MKNRTQNSLIVLCLFLSASLFSCKKEEAAPAMNEPSTEIFENPADIIEEPVVIGDVSSVGNLAVSNFDGEQGDGSNSTALTNSTYTRKNLIFNYGAEATNSLTSFSNYSLTNWAFQQKCCTNSIQRSTAFKRSGSYSNRIELKKTDADVFGSKRAETGRYTKSEPVAKVERWYAASYFLPATDYVYDAAAESPTQWHTSSTQYPPLAVWTQRGQWRLVQFGSQTTILSNYETNKWTDFVFHVKWSSGSDGLIEVWKNGVKILTKYGKNIDGSVTTGAYMRTGLYKWPWKGGNTSTTTKRVIYIDDVRIGNAAATYNDVVPGL
jgi:hypothetical protein